MRTGTLSCTTGSRHMEVSRWALTSSFGTFFYFSTLSSFCPSGAASKREVAGNCQSQIWGWTSHSSLFLCFPNCLQNLQNWVKGCHSIFPLQYFFVLFTKSVASVLMLKRLRWIGPFPKLSHRGLHYLNMPSFPNWQPNNLYNNFFKFRFFWWCLSFPNRD